MKIHRLIPLFSACVLAAGCISVEVKPIQITVSVKVDQALNDFFGDIDKKSSTINPAR